MAFLFTLMSSPSKATESPPPSPRPTSKSAPSPKLGPIPTPRPGPLTSSPVIPVTSSTGRLEVIMEHAESPPASPVKSHHRPSMRRLGLAGYASSLAEAPPPPYSPYTDVIGPNGEKLHEMRNNKYIAKRGGWKRLCVILAIALMIIVGLAVGLSLGLQKKYEKAMAAQASASTPSPSPTAKPLGPFPAGSYSISTYLDSVASNCTSNPNAWRCFPYVTYNQSAMGSEATFDWIITPSAGASALSKFTISSSNNPFALTFNNVPLELLDSGLSTERYRFQVPMDKEVVPSSPITDDNSLATCWFNGTTFQAELFTKMPKQYPPPSSPSSAASAPSGTPAATESTAFQNWPYAVEIEQVISGGEDVPECFKLINGNAGDQVMGLATGGPADLCGCTYKNTDASW
ncbi:MAG: hypothetical protein M1838_001610 [Thelocarpon superellum]|nr:MAG: hypothetical protein M1838_001610 [Thelocarpon superellum]